MSDITNLFYDWVSAEEIGSAHKIEIEGFPPDEAASLETFKYRQANAGDLFLGVYLSAPSGSRTLIGYVCSTLSPDTSLSHKSMSEHVPSSSSVCIHAVCTATEYRHKGVGVGLLREYATRLQSAVEDGSKNYERMLLITHEELKSFYEAAGFEWMGKSEVVHGSRAWFEMRKTLEKGTSLSTVSPEQPQAVPPGVWEALQRPTRNRPKPRSLATFGGIQEVCAPDPNGGGNLSNKFDLLCPREECGSVILKNGVAQWVERASVQMEPVGLPAHSLLPTLPVPPETAQWWLIGPSPMAFENIGFTRPVQSTSQSQDTGKRLKLLACAECDLGPLGWSEEGGTEFWLACSRVGYRE